MDVEKARALARYRDISLEATAFRLRAVRMALGASTGVVRRQVLRGAAIMAVAGVVFGLGGAFGLMQVLRSRLVGVSPLDPTIWSIAAILLVALVAMASLIPARQATRVTLADTLRAI